VRLQRFDVGGQRAVAARFLENQKSGRGKSMRTQRGIFNLALVLAAAFIWVTAASAAVTEVICVPWEGNPNAYHHTWDGKTILLKAVVKTDSTAPIEYFWNFGDTNQTGWLTLSGSTRYLVDAFHAYTGSDETPFLATLTARTSAVAGDQLSDTYRVRIRTFDLDAERAVAVDDALWWLYRNQGAAGNWSGYSSYYASLTGSAVHAFEVNNHLPSGDPAEDPYVDAVAAGLAYLFNNQLQAVAIGPQTYGDPDTNGNGIGITVRNSRPIYEGGMVMDAIINSRSPAADCGVDFDGDGSTDTYRQVIQDMVDMYAWGQYDSATVGGGWRYSWNQHPDNSAAQWGAIGMIPAERTWGCTVPQWVKDRNDVWLTYSYRDYGSWSGFGYTGPGYGYALTPCGMVQLDFCEKDISDPRWIKTEIYLANTWKNWNGNYYGYYAGFKALTLSQPAPVETFASTGFDWYRGDGSGIGLAKRLIEDQDRNTTNSAYRGRFRNYYSYQLAAAWATIILSGFEPQPVAVVSAHPNPTDNDVDVTFTHEGSYHLDATKGLALFEYDFDEDGVWDYSTTDIDDNPVFAFNCAAYGKGYPCEFDVRLRVTDDSVPVKRDTASLIVSVTPPPHDPTAVTGGPYTACPGSLITLDGSSSFDIDAGDPYYDYIASYGWELDGVVPYDFDDATTATIDYSWATAGIHNIGLRVTDSTGRSNTAWTSVTVDEMYCCVTVDDLTARSKRGKVQLVWTHVGADLYEIFRSDDGGATFAKIGETSSTYSTFLDASVTSGQTYQYYVKSGDTCSSDPVEITVPTDRVTRTR
jgi:hypothetical protein